jgi:hypothetical protein
MPYKPKIVTRGISTSTVSTDSIPKNAALTNNELDSNFLNIRDASIGIASDDSTVVDIALGNTLKVAGGTGISTAVSGQTLTITGTGTIETVTALTSSAAITVNCDLGTVFTVTLAHNATFTLSNFGTGQTVAIKIKQDATGGRTATFTGIKFLNAFSTLSTGANKIDFVTIFNDGTDKLAVLNVNYA